jgi:hypothetical protein
LGRGVSPIVVQHDLSSCLSGPRVKRTLDTAGDLSLDARRQQQLREILLEYKDRLDAAARLPTDDWTPPPAPRSAARMMARAAAAEWIFDHGGTIAAALKATHPDTGGTTEEFQRTIEARDVLEGRPQRP